ncbi:MAG: helix-turn-helix domain-containing protein [Nitrospirae bacterium]|nr:helix-turn-helix domain-containing protein [Nitrospirota bacterium]
MPGMRRGSEGRRRYIRWEGEAGNGGRPKKNGEAKKMEAIKLERLLKVEEVAGMLGYSLQGVYHLVFLKKLPCVKISKWALRFRREDIEAWVQSKSQDVEDQVRISPTVHRSPGRPRNINKQYVDGILNTAKREVLK